MKNIDLVGQTFHNVKRIVSLGCPLKKTEPSPLNKRIKQARESAGLQPNEAAAVLSLQRTQFWRLENIPFEPTAERLFTLSQLYGVDPLELYYGVDSEKSVGQSISRTGEVIRFVEGIVHEQVARPSPELVSDAVIEILKRDATQPTPARQQPFDPEPYRGLVTLIFKKDI